MKKVSFIFIFIIFYAVLSAEEYAQLTSTPTISETKLSFLYSVIISPEEWIAETISESKIKLAQIIQQAYEKNFNSVVLVVRKNGFCIYKSSYSPLLPSLKKKSDDTDILSFVISEINKYNMKLFVLIDSLKTQKTVPVAWLCKTEEGDVYTPYWLSCGNPEVQTFLRNLVKEFLRLYPKINGIIFDNLYYPAENTSYDDVSLYRFYTRGNPKLLEYEDYQREQLNKLVSDLYIEIKTINKDLFVGVMVQPEYKTPSTLTGGFYKNYQNYKLWVENNSCDFILPKFSTKTYHMVKEITKVVPKTKLVPVIPSEINSGEVVNFCSAQYFGVIYFSLPKNQSLNFRPELPSITLNTNYITGIVYDENSIPLADAWITLLSTANIEIGFTLTSADGFFSQPNVSTQPFHLQVEYPYAEKVLISNITLEQKEIKFTTITVNASSEKNKLFFYIYQPKEFLNYNKNIIHFLGRTFPEYKVSLFTDSVSTSTKVFSTGMFAFDNIKLNPAENKVVFTISDSKQNKITQQEFKIIYSTAQPLLPLQPLVKKDFELILPLENDVLLFSGDVLEIKLKAPENKKIYAVWSETLPKILLEETTPGVYEKKYLMPTNVSSARKKLTFELIEEKEFLFFLRKEEIKNVVLEKEVYIELWNSAYPLVAETISEKTPMTYGLHYVRLGGPYITELPKGIKLQIIGKQQDKLKVKLSASLSGWIDQKDVLLIKNATKPPHNFFTYCSITAEKGMDKIWIPWVEQVPFAVTPVVENNKNYIVVDFFNTHLAVTWLTYKSPSKILDNFKAYQIEDDHVQLKIPVKTRQLWGFIVENSTSGVTIYVKYPPKIDKNNPLKNITIALEAGHGGETNLGAIGLSGSKEKNINLKLVNVLKSLLEQHGAKVVLMRVGDTNPDFKQRIQTAIDANANIIISIHANASSTDKGFLRVSGTSVYYKYETSKLLSECIYYELLKLWKDDFGLVGNFNYTPLRQTIIPATLVEQGFMTHPYDEARMLDKNFRKLQAEAILQGIKKFLTLVAE